MGILGDMDHHHVSLSSLSWSRFSIFQENMEILGDMGTTMLMCDSMMMAVWQVLTFNLSKIIIVRIPSWWQVWYFSICQKNNYDRQDIWLRIPSWCAWLLQPARCSKDGWRGWKWDGAGSWLLSHMEQWSKVITFVSNVILGFWGHFLG